MRDEDLTRARVACSSVVLLAAVATAGSIAAVVGTAIETFVYARTQRSAALVYSCFKMVAVIVLTCACLMISGRARRMISVAVDPQSPIGEEQQDSVVGQFIEDSQRVDEN